MQRRRGLVIHQALTVHVDQYLRDAWCTVFMPLNHWSVTGPEMAWAFLASVC